MSDRGHLSAQESKRHPATWSAWKWLEQGEHDKTPEEVEYIAEILTKLDAELHALDDGSAYVV